MECNIDFDFDTSSSGKSGNEPDSEFDNESDNNESDNNESEKDSKKSDIEFENCYLKVI